jgi:hypothetical protein
MRDRQGGPRREELEDIKRTGKERRRRRRRRRSFTGD